MFGDEADEIVQLVHRQDPDIVVRAHNSLVRRKNPQMLALLGEVQAAGDIHVNVARMVRQNAEMARLAFEGAGMSVPALPDFTVMTPTDASAALCEWISSIVGDDVMDQASHRRQLEADTMQGSDRGLGVMEGSISAKSKRKFSSSLRDCGHMAVFASYSDIIDYLQVDSPKLNEILSAEHYMQRLGLSGRVFSANSLHDVLATIRQVTVTGDG